MVFFFALGGDVVAVNILLGGGDVCYSCGRNILICDSLVSSFFTESLPLGSLYKASSDGYMRPVSRFDDGSHGIYSRGCVVFKFR